MKTLLTIFILFFSSSMFAEDISDFQIEGMSIGDSLLDYMTEDEINQDLVYIYKKHGKKQKDIAAIFYQKNLKTFDRVQLDIKTDDNIYEIVGIQGIIFFKENIKDCEKKQKQIFNDLKILFTNKEFAEQGPYSHPAFAKGEVIILKQIEFFLYPKKRSNIGIICQDVSEKINKTDRLTINVRSDQFNEWLYKLYN